MRVCDVCGEDNVGVGYEKRCAKVCMCDEGSFVDVQDGVHAIYRQTIIIVGVRSLDHLYPYIRIEKHLRCEKLLGLAERNTKKHGKQKSGEIRTPIRYNVIHMYIFAKCFISLVR